RIPQVVCMIQKEVAERIAEKPGTKTYGILSVLLQAWYDIEYVMSVGSGCFAPPPKVQSAVIRLRRNARTSLGCDEGLFKAVVKTAFNQRRKTLRNSLKPLIRAKAQREGWDEAALAAFLANPVFDLRPERLSVEDFISLTLLLG
ncbi:MAG: 16S rRNA (adenine(1518)-N(6)/adenine(1519)-N(6))-dimethyltransferase, partial [Bacteroidales bacterium]|nr:16S rRNA (adenine(1518)-N(6)/adenine(1519)-N(6))-dimethyltransferase [Bacteroidales bacterium]